MVSKTSCVVGEMLMAWKLPQLWRKKKDGSTEGPFPGIASHAILLARENSFLLVTGIDRGSSLFFIPCLGSFWWDGSKCVPRGLRVPCSQPKCHWCSLIVLHPSYVVMSKPACSARSEASPVQRSRIISSFARLAVLGLMHHPGYDWPF